jgi:polysaccharide export outer membrane protein
MDGAGETTVLKALALAEGLAPFATKEAYIFRPGPSGLAGGVGSSGGRSEIPVALSKIMERTAPDVALAANDILFIPDNRARRNSLGVLEKALGFAASTASGILILGLH